jgi:hypothetical protein
MRAGRDHGGVALLVVARELQPLPAHRHSSVLHIRYIIGIYHIYLYRLLTTYVSYVYHRPRPQGCGCAPLAMEDGLPWIPARSMV